MSEEPQLEQRPARYYAGIRVTVPADGIAGAVDHGFPEVLRWLAANGIAPAGPPFIRYLVIDMDSSLRIDLGVPVDEPITEAVIGPTAANGRVRSGQLPAGRYAVLRHTGPYDRLAESNAALQKWAAEHGVTFDTWDTGDGSAWRGRVEHYLTDPSAEPDPAKWETDVAYLTSYR